MATRIKVATPTPAPTARNRGERRHPDEQEPDLISVPETARKLGIHADTLYALCRAGQFPPAIQIGSRWRISVPKLSRYLHGEAS